MKIQILSDLHLEMGVNPILKNFKAVGDVLVLAGDITTSRNKLLLEETFRNAGVPIVYVMGNHEYYKGELRDTLLKFREWFSPERRTPGDPEIHLLENNYVDINGVRFTGATYWSDPRDYEVMEIKRCIADFHVIKEMSITTMRNMHKASQWFIKDAAKGPQDPANNLKHVVVTHFPPSWQAREERFKVSALGSYFYNDEDDFVKDINPDLWIYGHTHGNLRFKCGNVPVECNQMGYTRGQYESMHVEPCYKDFDLNYVVEV